MSLAARRSLCLRPRHDMHKLLTKHEFQQAFTPKMHDITGREEELCPNGVLDLSPYLETIAERDFESHQRYGNFVDRVYRTSDDRFDQVLFMTKTPNVFMVVVIDNLNDSVLGHHLLDLNLEYGLEPPNNSFDRTC
jgi:hypothetical protein